MPCQCRAIREQPGYLHYLLHSTYLRHSCYVQLVSYTRYRWQCLAISFGAIVATVLGMTYREEMHKREVEQIAKAHAKTRDDCPCKYCQEASTNANPSETR
jgi:hypothetical protein